MQRTLIQTSSRSCLNTAANGSLSSDLASLTIKRSFGSGKRKVKDSTRTLLNEKARKKRIEAAGQAALDAKYARNAYNKSYTQRKKERQEAAEKKDENRNVVRQTEYYLEETRKPVREAYKNMKEDWALGALAPKRDVGEKAGKLGTVEMGVHQLNALSEWRKEEVRRNIGSNRFKVGDRVVCLMGRDRGKIGTIRSIDLESSMSAHVDGINKVAVNVPAYMTERDNDKTPFRIMTKDIRLDQLKLVASIRDASTGKARDVIVDSMTLKKVLVPAVGKVAKIKADPANKRLQLAEEDLETGKDTMARESREEYELLNWKWKTLRYVPGTEEAIPEPSEEQEDDFDKDAEAGSMDTLGYEIEKEGSNTWMPDLMHAPFSGSILREITFMGRKEITRYSTKLEASIRKKAEQREERQMQLEDRVRTPLMELKQELHKTKTAALKSRKAALPGDARPASQRQPVVAAQDEKPKQNRTPATNVMVLIGQAMAKDAKENPEVWGTKAPKNSTIAKRQKLLREVLAMEAGGSAPVEGEARV